MPSKCVCITVSMCSHTNAFDVFLFWLQVLEVVHLLSMLALERWRRGCSVPPLVIHVVVCMLDTAVILAKMAEPTEMATGGSDSYLCWLKEPCIISGIHWCQLADMIE